MIEILSTFHFMPVDIHAELLMAGLRDYMDKRDSSIVGNDIWETSILVIISFGA